MNQKALKTLEFDKIIHILTAHAASEGAKEMCRKLVPYDNINDVERAQRETADALRRVYRKGSVSFGGIRDIRGSLKRLEIGGILGMGELLQIMSLLETAGKIRQYGQREADDTSRDSLDESFEFLDPVPTLASEIRRCILADDEMASMILPITASSFALAASSSFSLRSLALISALYSSRVSNSDTS